MANSFRSGRALFLLLAGVACREDGPTETPAAGASSSVAPLSSVPPLESRPGYVLGNPLTPSAGYTPSLPNAITPASKQELAKKRKPTGDGCRAKKVVQAQGYLDDAHVNATLEF